MKKINGIELLALYGDDDRIGSFLPGLRRGVNRAFSRSAVSSTIYNAVKNKSKNLRKRYKLGNDSRVGSDDDVICGEDSRLGAFLPGLTKFAKSVGKVTSPFTTAIAKSFLPSSLVDAAAGFDPTKKGKPSATAILNALNPPPVVIPVPVKKPVDIKKIAIIAGAGVGALLLVKVLTSRPPQYQQRY